MIGIKRSGIELDYALLQKFTSEFDIEIEGSYLEFIKEFNGGTLDSNVIYLHDGEIDSVSVTSFFGFGLEPVNNIIDVLDTYKCRVPNGLLPVARTEGGNLICIGFDKRNQGKIYFWDHDSELLLIEPNKSVTLVANSFKEFMENIQANSGDEVSDYEIEEVWIDPDFFKEFGDK